MSTLTLQDALRRLALSGTEITRRIELARSPEYWLGLNSDMTIGEAPVARWDRSDGTASPIDAMKRGYDDSGYASLRGCVLPEHVSTVRHCVEVLRRHDWPPIFSFVYDSLWTVGRTAIVRELFEAILGSQYRMRPQISLNYVHVGSGWRPHFDGYVNELPRLSLWIPLSEATPENGSMYVVRRNPEINDILDRFARRTPLNKPDVAALMHRTTAVVARPGDLFFWNNRVLHWGGLRTDGTAPSRVSATVVYSSAPDDPVGTIDPLGVLPGFPMRLRWIAFALLENMKFDPSLRLFAPLARPLIQLMETSLHHKGEDHGISSP